MSFNFRQLDEKKSVAGYFLLAGYLPLSSSSVSSSLETDANGWRSKKRGSSDSWVNDLSRMPCPPIKKTQKDLPPASPPPPPNTTSRPFPPLSGVVLVLSGFEPARREMLHLLATSLGATFTRSLSTSANTHLVAASANGDKYELASRRLGKISIVSDKWLTDCHLLNSRLPESMFSVVPTLRNDAARLS